MSIRVLDAALDSAKDWERSLRRANDLYSKGGKRGKDALRQIDGDWSHVLEAQEWLAKNYTQNDEAARLCSSYPFIGELLVYLRLPARQRIQWGEAAAAAAHRIKDPAAEAAHVHKLAMAYIDLGEFRRAIPYLQQGVILNRKINRPAYQASDLGGLGLAYAGLGDHRRAITFYKKALALFRRTGNADARWGEGIYLSNLAESWRAIGDPNKAIALHQDALKINREVKDVNSESYALGNLGKAYADLGRHEEAQKCFGKSLALAVKFGARQSQGYSYFDSSRSLWAVGRRHEAIELAQEALAIFETLEDHYAVRARKQLAKWRKQAAAETV
jgi:tetratricopeptide (TPR) repeat protein